MTIRPAMADSSLNFRIFYWAAALVIAALTVLLLVEGRSLLVPFAVAVLAWFLVDAVADGIDRLPTGTWEPPRWVSVTAALIVVLGGAVGAINLATQNLAGVNEAAPLYELNLQQRVLEATAWLGLSDVFTFDSMFESIEIGPLIGNLAGTLAGLAGSAGLVLIYMLFLFLEESTFDAKVKRLFPDAGRRRRVQDLLAQINRDIRKYMWIKTLMSLITGGLSYMVLMIAGVDYAAFWGFVIFMLNYIPTIGSLLGIIFPSLLTLVQFDSFGPFLAVTPILATIQIVIGNFVEPRMMGGSLNLSPLVVILALAIWGSIWGVAGMFLSVPIMVILMIIFANFSQTRPVAVLLSVDGDVSGFRRADDE